MERLELVETTDGNTLQYAAVFAIIWGSVALGLFGYAFTETKKLTHSSAREPAAVAVGIYGDYPIKKSTQGPISFDEPEVVNGVAEYEDGSEGTRWVMDLPPGTRVIVLPRPSEETSVNCVGWTGYTYSSSVGTADGAPVFILEFTPAPPAGGPFRFNLLGTVFRVKITCSTTTKLQQSESFVGSQLRVRFVDIAQAGLHPTKTTLFAVPLFHTSFRAVSQLAVTATIEHAQNMQIYGGLSQSQSTTRLIGGETATIKYEDVRRVNDRDYHFVLVGAAIALGAAMLLEAVRPFVEWGAAGLRRLSVRLFRGRVG